ncbi:protein-L-isoaspartate O-methyltransferase family protein [Caldovatus aquaticus]|uniref:Protein-L-isoaspartate O-methyltransferase n=1 Tax=Caldovatus aquaticus TaxID=2865671 RepID=A0ABS7F1H5_9PROT|nr:protein-L-isoaspartate O-methyltransferase [Caldovatus aquaticus]MBW8269454.1 protein-L-isoaspartate O-methyltransferase [Caldovatus aquaticus]
MDYADARKRMVDGQLRPNKVTDPRLLAAMGTIPRERFLPEGPLRARAYLDEDVLLPGPAGRALTEPMALARLIQLAALRRGDRVLLLPAGTGYAAAVMAAMGAHVIGLESDEALVRLARAALAETVGPEQARILHAPIAQGHAAGAPYDVILIEGEVPEVPPALIEQLAEGGRLVTVLEREGRVGHAVLGRRIGGSFTLTTAFDCAITPVREFARAPAFVF